MSDLPAALLIAVVVIFLVVEITAEIVSNHTDAQLPKAFLWGSIDRDVGRRALVVEVPIAVALVLGGAFFFLMVLVDPISSIQVRFVAAAQLLATGAWVIYLARKVSERGPRA